MPQDFSHPAVRSFDSSSDDRSFDQLRRDVEQGLETLGVAAERTKQSGKDEQSDWAVKRVRAALDRLKRVPGGDAFVLNRLTAEFARRENELRSAEKSWLLAHPPPKTVAVDTINEDDDRATLLRANRTMDDSGRLISDIERSLGQASQTGRTNLDVLNAQGQDLEVARQNIRDGGVSARNAGVTLRRMAERAFYNRVFLWFLIALFFLVDVLFLYYGFIKKD